MTPSEITELLEEGKRLLEKDQVLEAIKIFQKATILDEKNILCWKLLGNAYAKNKKFDLAHDAYDKAILLDKNYDVAYYDKGVVFYTQELYIDAIRQFELSFENNPNNYECLMVIGKCYEKLHDYIRAIQYLIRVTEMNSSSVKAWRGLGQCYSYMKDFSQSLLCFDTALKIKPDDEGLWNDKAYCLALNGDFPEAFAIFEKELKDTHDGSILDTKGFILFNLKKYDDSLDVLVKAIGADSKNSEIWYHKGIVEYEKKEYEDAKKSFSKAIDINPKYAEAYNAKAVALDKLGEKSDVISNLQKAIEYKPSLSEAHHNLVKMTTIHSNGEHFWDFWTKSWKRKGVLIFLSIAAIIIIGSSFADNSGNIQSVRVINQTDNQIISDVTTVTSTQEKTIPESYLIVVGMILLIILSPEIKKAKIGPVELEMNTDLGGSKNS